MSAVSIKDTLVTTVIREARVTCEALEIIRALNHNSGASQGAIRLMVVVGAVENSRNQPSPKTSI